MHTDQFVNRHNGPRQHEIDSMLKTINVSSVDELINQTVPPAIRLKRPLNIAPAMSEYQYHKHLKTLASKNKVFKSYIGLGYYNTIIPAVIQRNILENKIFCSPFSITERLLCSEDFQPEPFGKIGN